MTHPLITWENDRPEGLREPVLFVALEGWIDVVSGPRARSAR